MKPYLLLYVTGPEFDVVQANVSGQSKQELRESFLKELAEHRTQESFMFQGHEVFVDDFTRSNISSYVVLPLFLTEKELNEVDLDVELVSMMLMSQSKRMSLIETKFPLTPSGRRYFNLEKEFNDLTAQMLGLRVQKREHSQEYKIAKNKQDFVAAQMDSLMVKKPFF